MRHLVGYVSYSFFPVSHSEQQSPFARQFSVSFFGIFTDRPQALNLVHWTWIACLERLGTCIHRLGTMDGLSPSYYAPSGIQLIGTVPYFCTTSSISMMSV